MNAAKAARIDKGLSLADAVGGSGVAYNTIKRLERGDEIGARQLKALADLYEVEHPHTLLLDTSSQDRAA